MPEAEQIDFDDPHVGAVVLVPLDDDAIGHRGVFERDDLVEASLADHHAAGMLAEVARQILDLLPERAEQSGSSGSAPSMPTSRRLRCSVSFGIDELELVHHLGQLVDRCPARSRAPCPLRARRSGRDR